MRPYQPLRGLFTFGINCELDFSLLTISKQAKGAKDRDVSDDIAGGSQPWREMSSEPLAETSFPSAS